MKDIVTLFEAHPFIGSFAAVLAAFVSLAKISHFGLFDLDLVRRNRREELRAVRWVRLNELRGLSDLDPEERKLAEEDVFGRYPAGLFTATPASSSTTNQAAKDQSAKDQDVENEQEPRPQRNDGWFLKGLTGANRILLALGSVALMIAPVVGAAFFFQEAFDGEFEPVLLFMGVFLLITGTSLCVSMTLDLLKNSQSTAVKAWSDEMAKAAENVAAVVGFLFVVLMGCSPFAALAYGVWYSRTSDKPMEPAEWVLLAACVYFCIVLMVKGWRLWHELEAKPAEEGNTTSQAETSSDEELATIETPEAPAPPPPEPPNH